MEISKTFEPKDLEKKWYEFWEENGYFKPQENSTKARTANKGYMQ